MDTGLDARIFANHVNVPLDKEALNESHCLHCYNERNGYQVTHDNHPAPGVCQCVYKYPETILFEVNFLILLHNWIDTEI